MRGGVEEGCEEGRKARGEKPCKKVGAMPFEKLGARSSARSRARRAARSHPILPTSTLPLTPSDHPFPPLFRSRSHSLRFDIDDVLEVGADGMNDELKKGIRTSALPLTHISHMHWKSVQTRAADNIEGNQIDLSSPPCQGGSTGIMIPNPVGQPHLVVHGGIRYPRNGVFHAYSSTLIGSKQTATYEDRVFVYSMVEMSWHVPEHKGEPEDKPPGRYARAQKRKRPPVQRSPLRSRRYGHCAVALPDRTMWTFGGRQAAGVCSGEVHIWDFDKATWRMIKFDRNIVRTPAPRFCASAA